jgi:hypothetical protein
MIAYMLTQLAKPAKKRRHSIPRPSRIGGKPRKPITPPTRKGRR